MSSLNLEPNPFEQSFAHTGKLNQPGSTASTASDTNINNNLQDIDDPKSTTNIINSSQFPHQSQVLGKTSLYSTLQSPLPLLEKQSTLPTSQLTSNNSVLSNSNNTNNVSSATHIIPSTNTSNNDVTGDPLSSNTFTMNRPTMLGPTLSTAFIFPPSRPNIQTPGALTPGGSKKLPPPVLSPNFLPSGSIDESTTNVISTNSNSHNSSANANVMSSINIPNNANANSYFSYIPRTGLTPNESNIRTGLTPGSLYPLLQSIGFNNNNNNNNLNPTNSNIVSTTNIPNGYKSGMTPGIPNANISRTLNSSNTINDYTKMSNNRYNLSPSPSVMVGVPMSLPTGMNTTVPFAGITALNSNNNNNVSDDNNNNSSRNSVAAEQKDNTNSKNNNDNDNGDDNNRGRRSITYEVSKEREGLKLSEKGSTKSRKRKCSLNTDEHQDSTEPKSKDVKSTNEETKHESNEDDKRSQEDLDEKERKRREFLERNRLAASKFRKRKKEYIQRIENNFRNLQAEYDEMRLFFDALCSFNTHKHNTSILSRLRFHLEQNSVTAAMNDLNGIESLIQNIQYCKRGGVSVLASEDSTASISTTRTTNSKKPSTKKIVSACKSNPSI